MSSVAMERSTSTSEPIWARLASAPSTHTTVSLALAPSSGGKVALAGDLTLEPIGFDGTLTVKDLALVLLSQPIATSATRLLKHGVASCDLAVAAGATPKAPLDGVRVTGTIALADLDVAGDDPKVFALRWKELAVALGAVTAPGVLGSGADTVAGTHRRRAREPRAHAPGDRGDPYRPGNSVAARARGLAAH